MTATHWNGGPSSWSVFASRLFSSKPSTRREFTAGIVGRVTMPALGDGRDHPNTGPKRRYIPFPPRSSAKSA